MNEYFKQSLIALKQQQMTLLSYANNHNIQTRLLAHFIMNIVPKLSNNRDVALMDYRHKQSKRGVQKPERNPQRLRSASAAFSGSVAASPSEPFSSR